MDQLPIHIHITFIVITLSTFGILFYFLKIKQGEFNFKIASIVMAWLILQTSLSLFGFYESFNLLPPRFLFVIMPALVFVTLRIIRGKHLPAVEYIGYIHIVRIPVEIVLYWLANEQVIPEIMTFRGRNFDVFAGIILPIATYLHFEKRLITNNALLIFNLYGLASLINIVGYGVLSAPTPIQLFGFEQPNIAIFHFPFIWLPAFIVPSILFAHLVSLKELIKRNKEAKRLLNLND